MREEAGRIDDLLGRPGARLRDLTFHQCAHCCARVGELVTKEELLGSVWRDTAVSDDALTSCVQELRKALADNAKHRASLKRDIAVGTASSPACLK
jgi:DNA-binding response OmpR family regulator